MRPRRRASRGRPAGSMRWGACSLACSFVLLGCMEHEVIACHTLQAVPSITSKLVELQPGTCRLSIRGMEA